MDKCIIFKSLLIYLLLCYGKKFIDAIEYRKTSVSSQQDSTSSLSQYNIFVPSHAHLNSNQSAGSSSNSFDLDDVDDSETKTPRVAAATTGALPQPRQRANQGGAQMQANGAPKPVAISLDDVDNEQDSKTQSQPPRQIKAIPVAASAGASPQPRARAQQQTPSQRSGQGASRPVAIALDDQEDSSSQDKSNEQPGERRIRAVPVAAASIPQQPAHDQGANSGTNSSGSQAQDNSKPPVGAKVITKTESGSGSGGSEVRVSGNQSASKTPVVKPQNPNSNPLETDTGTDVDMSDSAPQLSSPPNSQPQQQSQPESKLPIVKPSKLQTIPSTPAESESGSDIEFTDPSPQQTQSQVQPQPKPQQVQPQPKPQQVQPQPKPQQVQPQPKPQQVQPQPKPQQVQPQPKPQQVQPSLALSPLSISEPVEISTSSGENQLSINDCTKFTLEDYAYGYLFKFSNSNKCVGIKYGGKEVWTYTENPENVYPKSICLRKDNPVILFEFEGCYYLYGCVENKFKYIHYDEFYAVYNKIKVVTQHYSDLNENDPKAYDVIHYGLMFEYRFKPNHLCTEVKFNDNLAWSYDNSKYGDNFPTVMYFDVISPVMVSLFIKNTPYVFINLNGEWCNVEDVMKIQQLPVLPSKTPVTTSVPFLKMEEPKSTGESIDLDESEVEAPPPAPAPVSESQPTERSSDEFGSEIELSDSGSGQQPQPVSPEQPSVPLIAPFHPKSSAQMTPHEEDGSDLHIVDDIHVTEIRRSGQPTKEILEEYEEFTIEDKKEAEEDKLFVHESPVRLVVLDIQDTQTTKFINYSYDVITKTHIYTPKESYYISEVRMAEHVFWRATNDNYGFGVIFIEDLNNKPFLKVFIPEKDDLNEDDKTKIIEKEIEARTGKKPRGPPEADHILIPPDAPAAEGKPFEGTPEPKMPIMVDIRKRDTTDHYEYSRRNTECGMYTPKHNFIFKLVKTSRIIGSDVEIWCPEAEDEYVDKVFIDIIGALSNTYNVMLFLVNGNVKHFTLLNDRWIEVDPAVLLDISKTESTYEYDAATDVRNDITTFTPRGHFLFKGVKRTQGIGLSKSVVDIWNAKNKCDYARKAVLKNTKRSEKYLLLYLLSGDYKLFYRSNKGKVWRDESTNLSSFNNLKTYGIDLDEESMDKVISDKFLSLRMRDGEKIPVTLNIENRKNTNESYFVVNGPIVSFIPKHNIVFENVVLKSHVFDVTIWKAEEAYQHAYRVVMGSNPWNPFKKRSMALILLNGNFTFFEELEDYVEWKNTTETRYSLLNLKMYANDRVLNGRYKQIESGEYKIHSLAFLYGYTFNPGVECLEIRYRNLPIWKYSDHTRGGYPRGIYLNIANNGFYIKYFDRWMFVDMDQARAKYSRATPGPPKKTQPETPTTYALSCPLLVSNIRVTTLIGERPFVHHLNHFTLLEGYLVSTFEFTEKLFKVEYAEKIVWKHRVIRFGTHYPNKLYFDHLGYLIVSFTDNWYYVYEYSVEKWKIVCKNEIDKPEDLPGMAIITDEVQPMMTGQQSMPVPGKPERPQEVEDDHVKFQAEFPKPVQPDVKLPQPVDKSLVTLDLKVLHDERYEITYLENKVIYKAKAPNLFCMVKSGNDILWQATKGEYLYKVIYKAVDGKDRLKVYFQSDRNPILDKIKNERR
ncbi:hypothetical protein MACK_001758 [Theileria orientalis]|uniref:Uncharacterized protein n=1 Tax=Theileria orientalis TaxID=68886 RepID=A0A976MAZ6_THEOR|nr:hypothetical protein MACK_001758 [Theileria orientalis]